MRVPACDPLGSPSRRQQEWERIKAVLIEVYLQPGVRLDDAMVIMAEQHEFIASKMMYKKRLHSWGIRKNLNSNDKDKILGCAQLEDQTYGVRRKINRYLRDKAKQRRSQECEDMQKKSRSASKPLTTGSNPPAPHEEESRDCSTSSSSHQSSPAVATPTSVDTSTSMCSSTSLTRLRNSGDKVLLLHCASECVVLLESGHEHCPYSDSSKANEILPSEVFWREHWVQEMYFAYYMGVEALGLGFVSNAATHFDIAGQHLVRCLERPTHQLLIDLLDIIRIFSRSRHTFLRSTVYQYLVRAISNAMGMGHPFAVVIRLMIRHAHDIEWQQPIWESLIQDGQSGRSPICACLRLQAQSYYGLALESHNRLEDAINIQEKLLKKEAVILGTSHEATRRTLFRLGRLNLRNKDSAKAISILHRSLEVLKRQPVRSPDDSLHVLIYGVLARAHEKLDNKHAALNWYQCAFHESNTIFGACYQDSLWYLYELVEFLDRHPAVEGFSMSYPSRSRTTIT